MYSVILAIALPIWQPFWQQEILYLANLATEQGGMLAKTTAKKKKSRYDIISVTNEKEGDLCGTKNRKTVLQD